MNNISRISEQPLLSTSAIMFFFAAVAVLIFVCVMYFSKQKLGPVKMTVCVSAFILFAIAAVFVQNSTMEQQQSEIIKKVEKTHNVSNLRITEHEKLSCKKGFTGSLQAATWKTGKHNHVGVILGKKEKNSCIFSLKSVGER